MTTVLDVHPRRGALRRRRRGLDRPARARPHAGEEVRREGHPVLHRLRPHGLVPAPRRDRVRRQGDPARRLRQAFPSGCSRPARRTTRAGSASPTPACSPSRSPTPAPRSTTVEPGDEERMFYRLPWWKKVIVMAGGPTVNLVLAFLLFGGVFMLHGQPEPTTTVDEVSDCWPSATPETLNQEQRRHWPTRSRREAGRAAVGRPDPDPERHRGDLVGAAVGLIRPPRTAGRSLSTSVTGSAGAPRPTPPSRRAWIAGRRAGRRGRLPGLRRPWCRRRTPVSRRALSMYTYTGDGQGTRRDAGEAGRGRLRRARPRGACRRRADERGGRELGRRQPPRPTRSR